MFEVAPPGDWAARRASRLYTMFFRLRAEKRAQRIASDIAVVEDLIQRLPKVLERLRAAEDANGR